MMKRSVSSSSVLLKSFPGWEVRLTPFNKLFVYDVAKDTTHYPFLDKKGMIRFSPVSGNKVEPPEDVKSAAESTLKKQRAIRQRHAEDFIEEHDQYTFN